MEGNRQNDTGTERRNSAASQNARADFAGAAPCAPRAVSDLASQALSVTTGKRAPRYRRAERTGLLRKSYRREASPRAPGAQSVLDNVQRRACR